jgi:hypothetical protein
MPPQMENVTGMQQLLVDQALASKLQQQHQIVH